MVSYYTFNLHIYLMVFCQSSVVSRQSLVVSGRLRRTTDKGQTTRM
ncbi:MAG TPA: hypothetical protein V6C90_27645 [Coleofasciculaceae cyanobacterium]